jgi:hypothetical protein
VGLRALTRCYVALIIPVFFGPYYANLRLGIGTAFAVILAIVVCSCCSYPAQALVGQGLRTL